MIYLKNLAKVVIERIRDAAKWRIGEEQCGFRKGKMYVDQVIAVKQVIEKYCEGKNCGNMAFMDMEKAYDRDNRKAIWQELQM